MQTYECPVDGAFDAEPTTKVSRSGHDVAQVDASGQHPNMADQLASTGASLTREQWDELAVMPNPAWTPTFVHVELDDPVSHVVAVCPTCGTPVKVG